MSLNFLILLSVSLLEKDSKMEILCRNFVESILGIGIIKGVPGREKGV